MLVWKEGGKEYKVFSIIIPVLEKEVRRREKRKEKSREVEVHAERWYMMEEDSAVSGWCVVENVFINTSIVDLH